MKALQEYIEALNLSYEAKFIPFSESRNKNEKYVSVNWEITLGKNFTFPYSEGIRHFVKHQLNSIDSVQAEKVIAEKVIAEKGQITRPTGSPYLINKKLVKKDRFDGFKINPPQLTDVLYCLAIDANAINYTFEEWADDFGYDNDSITAKKTYEACINTFIKLKQLGINIDELNALYQDY